MAAQAMTKRRELVKKCQKIFENYKVHDGITILLLWGITWHKEKELPSIFLLQGNLNDIIQQAIIDQASIGWDKLQRGFLSKKWAMAQMVFMQKNGHTTTNWSKFFTKQVLVISWAMWSHRNEALHGTNQKELRDRHLQNLCSQVDLIYKRANELMPYNKDEIKVVFKQKVEKQKKHGVVALES